MNTEFPESPEDRMLDELLREQAHGPDEAYLKRLETAVDAGTQLLAKRPAARPGKILAVAAGIALMLGAGIWWRSSGPYPATQLAMAEQRLVEQQSTVPAAPITTHDPRSAVPEPQDRPAHRGAPGRQQPDVLALRALP